MASSALRLAETAFPERALPSGWGLIDLGFEDKNYTGFDIPAVGPPRAIIAFLTGCNSSPILYPDQIGQFSEAGYDVIGLPQLNKFQSKNPVHDSALLTDWFLLDPESPLHAPGKSELPIIIVSHCAGSLMTINALRGASEEQLSRFNHIFYAAPFLDIPKFLSVDFENAKGPLQFLNSAADRVRGAYANAVANEIVGHGPAERLKYRITHRGQSRPTPEDHWGRATYGQALQLQSIGRLTLQALDEGAGPAFKKIPQMIFSGAHDPNVCTETTLMASRILGASLIHSTAIHDLLREDPRVMAHILYTTNKIAPLPEPAVQAAPDQSGYARLLSGFRLAAQSGARSLDAGAGLLQRFFGRGIGNPEIG